MSGNIKKIVEPNSGIDYSLEKDFKIFTLSKELPITTYPSYIRLGIVIYCVKGNAKIDIYSNKHIITPKELIIILPGQLVALTDVSVDFQIRYFTITESFYIKRYQSFLATFLFLYEATLLFQDGRRGNSFLCRLL